MLVASQYQHALFGGWTKPIGHSLRADLKSLKLDSDPTLMGLHHFLRGGRGLSVPATLEAQLASLCAALDPAMSNPDDEVDVSTNTTIKLREIDSRFSHSVGEGFHFIRKYRCLTPNEVELLRRLEVADDLLSSSAVRRQKPAVASRVQRVIRDFSCRLVRRSVGVRSAVVRDSNMLLSFEKVVTGNEQLMHDAIKQVESLLNVRDQFVLTLNTTFGEPLPPASRRATLTTTKQRVRPREERTDARPATTIRFLNVSSGESLQSIPLTYQLFKSARQLQSGMLEASLPRTVLALLDTTRAKLAGRIVRDEDLLDGSEIRIGLRSEVIVRELQKFLIRTEP